MRYIMVIIHLWNKKRLWNDMPGSITLAEVQQCAPLLVICTLPSNRLFRPVLLICGRWLCRNWGAVCIHSCHVGVLSVLRCHKMWNLSKILRKFARLIIMGSGLEDWIYWHFDYNYNQLYVTAHSQWLPKTRSLPYWPTSVFSFTVTNAERRITAHCLNCLLT
jgi:hypothetical protein